jgi:hypothetical protein
VALEPFDVPTGDSCRRCRDVCALVSEPGLHVLCVGEVVHDAVVDCVASQHGDVGSRRKSLIFHIRLLSDLIRPGRETCPGRIESLGAWVRGFVVLCTRRDGFAARRVRA